MNFAQFGKNKDFIAYPQLLDIHVVRMLAAHGCAGAYLKDSDLLRSGLVFFNGFLGSEQAELVAEEISKVKPKDKRTPQSQVANMAGSASFKAQEKIEPVVLGFFQDRVHSEVTQMLGEMTYLQHLLNMPDDADEQKVFHSDTFFPCVKFWYFPRAVGKDGCFWYVPHSPVLSEKLIDWHKARVEDLKSGKAEEWRGWGHKEGSFRISLEEIAELGLTPTPVCVEADTLVVANVFGFHKRGDTTEPIHRLAIHGSIRMNPFP